MNFSFTAKEILVGLTGLALGGIFVTVLNENRVLTSKMTTIEQLAEPLAALNDRLIAANDGIGFARAKGEAALESANEATQLAGEALRDAKEIQEKASTMLQNIKATPDLDKVSKSITSLRTDLEKVAIKAAKEAAASQGSTLIVGSNMLQTQDTHIVEVIRPENDVILITQVSGSASRESSGFANAGVRVSLSVDDVVCGTNMSFEGESVTIGFFASVSCTNYLKGGSEYTISAKREDIQGITKNKILKLDYILVAARS